MKTNKKWVEKQFEIYKRRKSPKGSRYRDVLLITSFIETIIKETASKINKRKSKKFKSSLEALELNIHKDEINSHYEKSCKYKKDCLKEINLLRFYRNELLHDIIKENLPEDYIRNIIKEMSENIEIICTKSKLIQNYFANNYEFDPKEKL